MAIHPKSDHKDKYKTDKLHITEKGIGRERKIAVEKKQAYYQSQVRTGNAGRVGH